MQVLLEVAARGFRLLRLGTEVPLFDFPFAHIHSWGHLPNKFSFKFFEDKTKAIILYTFETRLVDQLLGVRTPYSRFFTIRKNPLLE